MANLKFSVVFFSLNTGVRSTFFILSAFSSEINLVVVFSVILCKYVLNLSSQDILKNDSLLYQVLNKVQVYLIQVHTRGHLKSELK